MRDSYSFCNARIFPVFFTYRKAKHLSNIVTNQFNLISVLLLITIIYIMKSIMSRITMRLK